MKWLYAAVVLGCSSIVSVGAVLVERRVKLGQPAGEPDLVYQDPGYMGDPANAPDATLQDIIGPSVDDKLLHLVDARTIDNEKCRILCQSPYSCREVRRPWWKKSSELCQRWGMNKLGEPFAEELFAVHLDLGACMRKCDKVFPLEEGIPVAPAPRARTTTTAPPVIKAKNVTKQEDDDGEPSALPTLSPQELKEQDEEYLRETAPQPPPPKPKPKNPIDTETLKNKYPNMFKYDQPMETLVGRRTGSLYDFD